MKNLLRLLAAALCVVLAGCQNITLVPPGTATVNEVSFTSSGEWNKFGSGLYNIGPRAAVCTADGLGLDMLIVVSKVEPGKGMFRDTGKDHPMPKFDPAMLPHELEGFVLSSLTNLYDGELKFRSNGLRPTSFGGAQGVSFGIDYATSAGLAMKGDVLAAIVDGKLSAVLFMAAREHYYEKYAAEIKQVFSTARVL